MRCGELARAQFSSRSRRCIRLTAELAWKVFADRDTRCRWIFSISAYDLHDLDQSQCAYHRVRPRLSAAIRPDRLAACASPCAVAGRRASHRSAVAGSAATSLSSKLPPEIVRRVFPGSRALLTIVALQRPSGSACATTAEVSLVLVATGLSLHHRSAAHRPALPGRGHGGVVRPPTPPQQYLQGVGGPDPHDHRPGSVTTLSAVGASGRSSPLRESTSPATSRIYAA